MQKRKTLRTAIASTIENLEGRRLLATFAPINLVALWDDTQNFGNTRRSIAFYDASNTPSSGTNANYFAQNPLFTVWVGYEDTPARNFEDLAAFDVDEASGKAYVLAFDSSPGSTNSAGDTGADYDIYRIDLRAIYDDYLTNHRNRGIMYAPAISADGFDYVATYGSSTPAIDDSAIGVPALRNNIDADTKNDIIFFAGASAKVGEVARRNAAATPAPPSFAQQTIEVVDDNTIILLENKPDSLASGASDRDYTIRTLERVSTTPGLAQYRSATDDGGYNGSASLPVNTRPTESWESKVWTGDNAIKMDLETTPGTLDYSEADQLVYVNRDGVKGVWVSERDGGGDDFSFFKLDFANRVAQKQEIKVGVAPFVNSFALDEDPVANPNSNDGDVDWFQMDSAGNLVISETGFSDTPQHQPKVITREVLNYNAGDSDGNGIGEITLGAWGVKAPVVPTVNEPADAVIINGNFGAYVAATNKIYYFDSDSSTLGTTDVVGDAFVYDVATGTLSYEERNAANHFFVDASKNRGFTLTAGGDTIAPTVTQSYAFQTEQSVTFTFSEALATSGAGAFTAADITLTNTTTSTVIPTADLTLTNLGGNQYKLTYKTGASTTPLAKGVYTVVLNAAGITDAAGNALTAPATLTFKVNPGDSDQDGDVDFDDLLILSQNYGTSGKNYSQGNFNYDAAGNVDFDDLLLLSQNYGTALSVAKPTAAVTKRRTSRSTDVLS